MHFRFVDYVMFSHNGANRSELKKFSSPDGDTGAEVCRLRLHLLCDTFEALITYL